MDHRIKAIFENGAFRPESQVQLKEGQRVTLQVDLIHAESGGIDELLDLEYMDRCRTQSQIPPSVDDARTILLKYQGSLADLIQGEREER